MQNNTILASIPRDNLDQVTGGYLDHDPGSGPDDSGIGHLSPARCPPLSSPQQSAPRGYPLPSPHPSASPVWVPV